MRRAVIGILLLVVVVGAGLIATGRYLLAQIEPAPIVLMQEADGNLVTLGRRQQLRPLTTDARPGKRSYSFPVPAPDNGSIAYVATTHGASTVTSDLVVHPLSGEQRSVYSSDSSRPFYLHWSPNSAQIAFLTGENGGTMRLRNVAADGKAAAQLIKAGQPSYFAWTPDSKRLFLHTNGNAPHGSLSIWQLGAAAPEDLAPSPAFFRAPAWLPDGETALATIEDQGSVALAQLGSDGSIKQRLARTRNGLVFVPAPSGQFVAYTDQTTNAPSLLHLVTIDGRSDQAVSAEDAITFFWSPDSTQIAYLTLPGASPTQPAAWNAQPQIKVQWHVFNLATQITQDLAVFTPSDEFFSLLPFFDQYAQSLRLWSRTSTELIYADTAGVWTLNVTTGAQTKLGTGVLGMWMD